MFSPPDDRDLLLKIGEVGLIPDGSRTQIYRLLRSEIPCLHIGIGTVRVLPVDLGRYKVDRLDIHGQGVDQHV